MFDDEIGKVFGVVAVEGDLSLIIGQLNYVYGVTFSSRVLGSVIFNSMFTPLQRMTDLPGAAYLVGASFLLLPLLGVISVFLMKQTRQEHRINYQDNAGFQNE